MLCDVFNHAVSSPSDRKGTNTYCIVAIEDKKMGFISYCLSLSLYIMSPYLMWHDEDELTQAIWWKPHLVILDGNNTIRVGSPSVTRIEHRKIEPKAKHFSHCKKNQSSCPNQIDSSNRLAKISNHAYKNSEEIQIIFIDKRIINPQFIGSQQTHRKRVLHRIDLQEHRGEHGTENQRERRIHLTTSYGPVGPW